MSNIVPDEKILCFNCDKAYYQKVIEDFVFTNKKGQVITVPDVLTHICPKCKDKSYSYKEVLKIEAYLEKVKNTSKN